MKRIWMTSTVGWEIKWGDSDAKPLYRQARKDSVVRLDPIAGTGFFDTERFLKVDIQHWQDQMQQAVEMNHAYVLQKPGKPKPAAGKRQAATASG